MASARTCSIVVPTLGRPEALRQCLAAMHTLDRAPLEVIVVDNSPGAADPTTRDIAGEAGARYLHEPRRGLCAARNTGARAARGDVVAYLDDDAVPESGWTGGLLAGFVDPQVAAVTGQIRPFPGARDAEGAIAEADGSLFERNASFTLDRSDHDWFAIAAFGGLGNGTNMAFRRSLFDTGFAFHERTGRGTLVEGYDEHFAFLELIARGHRIAFAADAVVRHPLPASVDELRQQYLRDLGALSAYVTLLAVERPRHLGALARFVWQGLRGTHRPWRTYRERSPELPRLASPLRAAMSLASGPARYVAGLVRR